MVGDVQTLPKRVDSHGVVQKKWDRPRWLVSVVPILVFVVFGWAAAAAAGSDRLGVPDALGVTEEVIPARTPVFAAVGDLRLREPSADVEMVGFHESGDRRAKQLAERDYGSPQMTLPTRGRPTGTRSAADVVAAPDEPVLAPVTGRVTRAGSYNLYSRYPDHYVAIKPDDQPGWEVKILHFHGLHVKPGDHVKAGDTVIGARPRSLAFRSQIDRFTEGRNWPHVHLEVLAR